MGGMKKSMAKKMMKSMRKRAMKKSAASYKSKRGALTAVFKGKIMKSKGGLKKDALMKTKKGKVVSKKMHLRGKANKWIKACNAARAALKVKGFSPIKKGTALYKKAKSLYK